MDEDLKIVLTSVLEADEQSSAQRISAQLPNIAKLINSNSKIKIQVALDESNAQSQAQKVSKQIQNTVTKSAIKMDVDIGYGKISEMVERLKELKVPDSAIKTFRDNIKEANISVTDITTSFDAMSRTVTAVVTGVNKFGDTVRQTQGVRLGVNEETGELIYELNKDIVVYQQNIEKVAQAEAKRAAQDARNNESRIAYLTKQKAILSDIQASYTGATSAKPVKDTSHLDALNAAYKDLQDKINVLIGSEGKLDQVQRAGIESQIAGLKQLVKEYQNAEYVATKLRTKDIGSIKADQFAALDTLEKRLQSAGTLTDGFQRGIDGLRGKLQNTFDPAGLTSFLNSFDKLNNGVSVFQEKLRGANAIYAQLINIESKITKTQSLLVGLDTQVDKDKVAILKEQLSNYQLQQKALNDQLIPYASIIQYAKQAEAAERVRLENELKLKYSEAELAVKAREIDEVMQRIPSTIADLQTKFYQLDNPTDNLVNKMRMLRDMQAEYGNSKSESEKVAIYQRLNKLVGECNTEMTALLRVQRGGVMDVKFTAGLDKAKADLADVARKWSALKSDPGLRTQLKQLEIDLKNVKSQTDLTKWTAQFSKFKSEVKAAGKNMLSLGDTIVNNAKKVLQWVSATTLLFRAFRLLKNAVSTVVDLDTAMIDLRKVTSATNEEYRKFYLSANETAKALGVTTEAVISQTAEWARLGLTK